MTTPEELRLAYLATVISIELEPGDVVDVASAVELLPTPVFIITAWNPFSEVLDPEENDSRNLELQVALTELGATTRPAVGSSPSGDWAEESFAVTGIDRAEALGLGRRFGQHAIFEIATSEVRVLASDGSWVEERPLASPAQ